MGPRAGRREENKKYRSSEVGRIKTKEAKKRYNQTEYGKKQRRMLEGARRKRALCKLWEIKRSSGCSMCGECDPRCLDFHHRDPSTKDFTISMKTNHGWAKIQREVDKCSIVCSNCHRKLHILQE